MKSKRIAIIIFSVVFVLCFAACGSPSGGMNVESTPSGGGGSSNSEKTSPKEDPENNFIGLWHGSPSVGSGFSERLLLDDDNTFIWAANQMDGLARVRVSCGTWSLDGDKLILETIEEIRWVGGKPVPAIASWATDEVIEDAEVVLVEFAEPEVASCYYDAVTTDPEAFDKRTITIGGKQYWELAGPMDRDDLISDCEVIREHAIPAAPVFSKDEPKVPGDEFLSGV